MNQPRNLLGAPPLAYHPAPAPARLVEARPLPARYLPAPTLTVTPARRLLLSNAFLAGLNLKQGQRVDLVPKPRGQPWELDTESRTGYPVRIRRDGKAWLTLAHEFRPEHFHRPGTAGPALRVRLFTLGAEDPARPGIYLLHPLPCPAYPPRSAAPGSPPPPPARISPTPPARPTTAPPAGSACAPVSSPAAPAAPRVVQ